MTATRGAPGRSSAATSVRPSAGGTRSAENTPGCTAAASMRSGASRLVSVTDVRRKPASSAKDCDRDCQSTRSGPETALIAWSGPVVSVAKTSEAGSANGSGCSKSASTTEKTAQLAAIPNARERMAARETPGERRQGTTAESQAM